MVLGGHVVQLAGSQPPSDDRNVCGQFSRRRRSNAHGNSYDFKLRYAGLLVSQATDDMGILPLRC